jgi:hypothetical protein
MDGFTSTAAYIGRGTRLILLVTAKHYLPSFIVPCVHAVFMAVALPHIAFATSIVAIIDSQQYKIVLGADSLITTLEQRRGQAVGHYSGCKIVVMPDCVVAMAGATFSPRFTFDLHRIARKACGVSGDLHNKADAFAKQALGAIRTLSQQILKISPAIYQKNFTPGHDIVQALFAGVQDRHLSLLGRAIVADSDATIHSKTVDAATNTPTPYALLGQNEAIIDYIGTDPEWDQDDSVVVVKKLLDMEVRARPDLVGPPISILEINQDLMSPEQSASKWLIEGACADISE